MITFPIAISISTNTRLTLRFSTHSGSSTPTLNLQQQCPLPSGPRTGDAIDKNILTPEYASILLENFKRDSPPSNLPFLIIPATLPLDQFRIQRPMLLLAVLIAASRDSYALQETLDAEFRDTLSQRVMIAGERNLDLVQGLLLYVAWFTRRFTLPDKQLFMFVQLAATVALDLDLEKPDSPPPPSSSRTSTAATAVINTAAREDTGSAGRARTEEYHDPEPDPDPEPETSATAEAKRTLIAVYYFSSSTSLILRKPILMKHSYKIWDCCRALAATRWCPTDVYLIHYVHLQGLAEEIEEAFGYSEGVNPSTKTAGGVEGIEFRVNTYANRLHQLRRSIPDGVVVEEKRDNAGYDVQIPHEIPVPSMYIYFLPPSLRRIPSSLKTSNDSNTHRDVADSDIMLNSIPFLRLRQPKRLPARSMPPHPRRQRSPPRALRTRPSHSALKSPLDLPRRHESNAKSLPRPPTAHHIHSINT